MIKNILDQLSSTSKRTEKEAILDKNRDNKILQEVFLLALNPMVNFYIKKIPQYNHTQFQAEASLGWALSELELLSNRTLTGNKGIEHLQYVLSSLSEDDAYVIERIISRDLRCGVQVSTVNKIWKDLVPDTPYMRCSLLKDMKNVDWAGGVYSQVKADGSFVYINHNEDGSVELFTRSGSQYDVDSPIFEQLVNDVRQFIPLGYQLHGEMLVEEGGDVLARQTGNGILNSILKGGTVGVGQEVSVDVWDMIPISEFKTKNVYSIKYNVRLSELADCIEHCNVIQVIPTKIVFSMQEAIDHYNECVNLGLEGTILKLPNAVWKDGTSKEQFKVKVEFEVDLEVISFNPGNGKNANTFGSLMCKTSDEELIVNVSGFTDDERLHLNSIRDEVNGSIITVRSNSIMKPSKEGGKYSLFLPRFIERRLDKTKADSLQRVIDQFEAVLQVKGL